MEYQRATDDDLDLSAPPRTRRLIAALVIGIHVVAVMGLIQAFAPSFSARVADQVLSTFTVTVTTPPPSPKPPPPKAPDKAGAAAPAGKKAVPKAAAAPQPKVAIAERPAPAVAAKGFENTAGASAAGTGTGAGGQGSGTGSGAGGNGSGGGMAVRPSVRSGELNNAADFPVPEGGRQSRFGKSVTVVFTVTIDGRARDCSVARSTVDAQATALVCGLVIRKIRFYPARRGDGTPVEARYGYKVDFLER